MASAGATHAGASAASAGAGESIALLLMTVISKDRFAEHIEPAVLVDGMFIHVEVEADEDDENAPSGNVFSLSLPDGRESYQQDEALKHLSGKIFVELIEPALLDVVSALVPADDARLPKAWRFDRARGPWFYMLPERAELGITDSGITDGTTSLRCSCPSWHVVIASTREELAMAVECYPHDLTEDPVWAVFIRSEQLQTTEWELVESTIPKMKKAAGERVDPRLVGEMRRMLSAGAKIADSWK